MSSRSAQAAGPATSCWLLRGSDGRLSAYAPADAGLLRWTEQQPGGPDWTGPEFIEAPGLTHATLAQGPDAYIHLITRRSTARGVELMHATQYQTGRPFGPWHSLGNPHKDEQRGRGIGVPAAVVCAEGRVHVFVRNAGRGVSLRRQAKSGKWEGWKDLKGSHLTDALPAAVALQGRVELLAPAEKQLSRWDQEEPGGDFAEAEPFAVPAVAGSLTGLCTADGRATYFGCAPGNTGVTAHRTGADALALGGAPDGGPVAVLRTPIEGHDCTVLAHRARSGRPAIAACPTEGEADGLWWTETGEPSLGAPALAVDAQGRVVLASIAEDGTLRVARQKAEPGLALAAWTRA
ncbi:hypothetical protein [Streptomyces sp. NBC_00859]|uniref:hypothetical protein n=1 Tax=Streptomyces sp. NBC_00859 TaxID=2903682 RepID=UPI0038706F80|nr:hypothetical protein OG584_06695 [Streptomyces sp. NBC_00859]